ncbi:MAG: cytochrome c biogenesis protein CcdA, partial [Flavipsychrobacter sp.]
MKAFRLALLFFCMFALPAAHAQITQDPTTWTFEAKKKSGNHYELTFHLKIKEGWHIYAMKPGGDGTLISPSFTFDKAAGLKLIGGIKEKGKLISETMEGIDGIVNMYKVKVDYVQDAEVTGTPKIAGKYEYQVCDDHMCLPPKTKPFAFNIEGDKTTEAATAPLIDSTTAHAAAIAPVADTANKQVAAVNANSNSNNTTAKTDAPPASDNKQNKSLLWLFLAALGGGIAAVLTPCVYSMIPITVSFFTKRSKTRQEGIKNAIYYSLSIIIIFTLLGVLISAIFGSNALNNLSNNWIANLFFFAIFIIFGISFLGAFEIALPSSWTSKTDSKAGTGSFGGIFFMALTLAIVSFSCTGPIVGPLLVLAGRGGLLGPTIGMLGFSIGLALPFALFAVFPGMLNKLATSGGWLNQVKVTLGFVELALALKFLSNADLARGWRL